MEVLTRAQAAEILGVCKRTILSWEKKGILKPNHYLSNRPRYLYSDVVAVTTTEPRKPLKAATNGE
jgi:predicted site-specific integrase-resolvase